MYCPPRRNTTGPSFVKRVDPALWPVMKRWVARVENWCHADCLSGLYSRLLEADPDAVLPELRRWNANEALWPRRVSIVSLIHYTGKNAVFLGPETVLPMIDNCVEDRRYYMQKAVGCVLREMRCAYPQEIRIYVEANLQRLPASSLNRVRKMGKTTLSTFRPTSISLLARRGKVVHFEWACPASDSPSILYLTSPIARSRTSMTRFDRSWTDKPEGI